MMSTVIRELKERIESAVKDHYGEDLSVELKRTEEKFGDFSTNIALQIAGKLSEPALSIAEALADNLRSSDDLVCKVEVARPGFINFTLADDALQRLLFTKPTKIFTDKVFVVEYSDPNPFKVLHAGHLYTSVVGDAIANLIERSGATVHRVNFGGDVGLHVAKTMWAILKEFDGDDASQLDKVVPDNRSDWMAQAYVEGSRAYDLSAEAGADDSIRQDIASLNSLIYSFWDDTNIEKSSTINLPTITGTSDNNLNLKTENIEKIYRTCRDWSYEYFDQFYERIGIHFEKYYPESQTTEVGLATVRSHIADGIFQESNGAIIFDGEKFGLHTRVFINSNGLATYETKDIGLSILKQQDYHFDRSVIITANEQEQYMAVVLKSIEQFAPDLANATTHLTHGMVKLSGGVKMSSRKGNFLRAIDILDEATRASTVSGQAPNDITILGAIKYAFLKSRMGGDIVYDPLESVSLEGNSGPYLQYAHARARSILRKASESAETNMDVGPTASKLADDIDTTNYFEGGERSLVWKLSEYSEVIDAASKELAPHIIATYLYELAQAFNRFYEHNRVIGDVRQAKRVELINTYCDVLKQGLGLLGIDAPEKM